MGRPVKVLLADDHPVFRRGLARLLATEPRIEVVGEACDGNEAIAMAGHFNPDVILMDIAMPVKDGISAMREILESSPDVKIIALTVSTDRKTIGDTVAAGAVGFLQKEADLDDITKAIQAVHMGHSFYSPAAAGYLRSKLYQRNRTEEVAATIHLTRRELDIVRLIVSGYSNRRIAGELIIAERTVKNHINAIFRKLHVSDRSQAIVQALRMGLVSLD